MKIALLSLLTITLVGCTSKTPDVVKVPVCAAQKAIVAGAANVIATTLNCSGKLAIEADITKAVGGLKLCPEATSKGPVGSVVCPLVVSAVTGLIKEKAPSAWECKVNDTSKVAELLKAACIVAIPLSE